MPAVAEQRLSLDEFHARYDGEKPYFEYWDGEAVQKSMPAKLHSLVQRILANLLEGLGYEAGQEVTLKLDPAYEPIPDVIAGERIGDPYPTESFEVAVEILSPVDPFARVLRKCRLYEKWGVQQISVIDPKARQIWSFNDGALRETDIVARRGGHAISANELWAEVDKRLR